jgi:nucleoid DNA-binding protein
MSTDATADHVKPSPTGTVTATTDPQQGSIVIQINEIASRIEDKTGVKKNLSKTVIKALAEVATEEIKAGNDFTVPGIVRINWNYRKPQKKGARWSAGDEVAGIGGEVSVKDADSPEVKARVKLEGKPMPVLKKNVGVPQLQDRKQQSRFLTTRAGKAIADRKG